MNARSVITPAMFGTPPMVNVPTLEQLFQQKLAIFQELAPQYAYFLAADPVVKVLRCFCLAELMLYALANDRALATTLTNATGIDLDAVGLFYGVTRMTVQAADPTAAPPALLIMEADDRYRVRIADSIVAFSAGGTEEHYRFHAMSADIRVVDAKVYSPDLPNFVNMGGRVVVAIVSTEENGVPSLDLLGVVRDAVKAKDTKVASDILDVEPATVVPINLVASVVLERGASADTLLRLNEAVASAFAAKQSLGWDAPKSWFTRTLATDGVHDLSISSPSTWPTVYPNQFLALASVTIHFAGVLADDNFNTVALERERVLRSVHDTYIEYAVSSARTRVQIQNDLTLAPIPGIIQPTLTGVADYLGLTNIRDNTGTLLPVDQVAIIIHFYLSKYYERGYYTTH